MASREEVERIISTEARNGGRCWARSDGNVHAPAGCSTIDVLYVLGDLGVRHDEYDTIEKAIGLVFSYYDGRGQFRYAVKSPKLPCIAARFLAALGSLGYAEDERVAACYAHLLDAQEEDGGWRCATARRGKSASTDASNPGTTLYVLDAFRYRRNGPREMEKLGGGVRFLLGHWDTRLPLGPCRFGIGSTFMKTEYPFLRYNIFYYTYVVSKYGASRADPRYREAVDALMAKAGPDGLVIENPHGEWAGYSFSRKGRASEVGNKKYDEILGSLEIERQGT